MRLNQNPQVKILVAKQLSSNRCAELSLCWEQCPAPVFLLLLLPPGSLCGKAPAGFASAQSHGQVPTPSPLWEGTQTQHNTTNEMSP